MKMFVALAIFCFAATVVLHAQTAAPTLSEAEDFMNKRVFTDSFIHSLNVNVTRYHQFSNLKSYHNIITISIISGLL